MLKAVEKHIEKPLGEQEPARSRWPWILLAASLVVHLVLWKLVVHADVMPLYDEESYLIRAHGFHDIIQAFLSGAAPGQTALDDAYGHGVWAPLHSLILGAALFLPYDSVASARLVVALIASFSILLIYGIGLRISNEKAARAASLCYLIYPPFLAFSHLLWSETTYTFLLLAAVYCLLLIKQNSENPKIINAVACGLCLGLAALTRAAALPAAFTICGFIFFYARKGRGFLNAAVVIAVLLIFLSPWLITLHTREGRFVPVSTIGGYNLYLGNNPWIPDECGNACDDNSVNGVNSYLKRVTGGEHNYEWDHASGQLAFHYITATPGTYLRRCVLRLRMTWTSDVYLIRHVVYARYGDAPRAFSWAIWVAVILGHAFIVLTALLGMLDRRIPLAYRALFIALAVAGTIVPTLTLSVTRFNYPTIVLLLPLTGHVIASRSGILQFVNKPVFFSIAALFLFGLISSLPYTYSHYFNLDPSSIGHTFMIFLLV